MRSPLVIKALHRKNVSLLPILLTSLLVCLVVPTNGKPATGKVILVTTNDVSEASPSEQYQYQQQPFGPRNAPRASNFGTKSAGPAFEQQIHNYQDNESSGKKQYKQQQSTSNAFGATKSSSSGYGSGGSGYGGGGSGGYSSGPIQAAVISRHQIHYLDVPSDMQSIKPTTVEVGVSSVPINIILRSSSSSLNVQQVHDGAKGSFQETESTDEPHMLKHTVLKPIIQEVYEMITPYRYIKQELQPVQEVIQTIISRESSKQDKSSYGSTKGGGGGGGYQAIEPEAPVVQQQQQVTLDDYQQSATKETSSSTATRNSMPKYELEPEVASKPHNGIEQQVLEQIGQDYIAASSNALLTSVYGAPAFTTPDASPKIRPPPHHRVEEDASQLTPIDSDLVNQYLPLVFEVMNSMEEPSGSSSAVATDNSSSRDIVQ